MTTTVQDVLQYADWTEYKRLQRALKRGQKAAGQAPRKRRRVEAPEEEVAITHRAKMKFNDPAKALHLVNVASIASATPDSKPGVWLSVGGVLYDRITDDEAYLAAIRAGLKDPIDFGAVKTWAVEGFLRGRRVRALYRGTEAALRMLWPDTATRKELRRAGCLELELMGVPFAIEDRTVEFEAIADPTHITAGDLWAARFVAPKEDAMLNAQEAQEGPSDGGQVTEVGEAC